MHRRAQKVELWCSKAWARAQGFGARTCWRWKWFADKIAVTCERTDGMPPLSTTVESRLRTRGDRSGTWSGPPGARGLHGARAAHAAAGRALSWLHSPCCEAIGARDVANTCIGPATEVGTSSEEAGSWFRVMPPSFTLPRKVGGSGHRQTLSRGRDSAVRANVRFTKLRYEGKFRVSTVSVLPAPADPSWGSAFFCSQGGGGVFGRPSSLRLTAGAAGGKNFCACGKKMGVLPQIRVRM
jgi:hypothetical protein